MVRPTSSHQRGIAGVSEGLFTTTAGMLAAAGKTAAGFLEVKLEPVYTGGNQISPSEEAEKKKRTKKSQGRRSGAEKPIVLSSKKIVLYRNKLTDLT